MTNVSEAIFGQIDWKFAPTLKTTLGVRYSHDNKNGSESVRLLCFAVPACFAKPEFNPVIPGGVPAVDLTQLASVVSNGKDPAFGGGPPPGVTGPTTYNPNTGFATRYYNANWGAVTGTAGLEWTPDSDTLVYGKYSRGYKSGGYNIGIFTVLSFRPKTEAEHVDSFEVGLKKSWGHNLTTDIAAFWYNYQNLQIPIAVVSNSGGLSQSSTQFYNVPKSISRGVELEATWTPFKNFDVLFDYSYLDAFIQNGVATDSADPDGLQPGAKVLACTTITGPAGTPIPGGATPCGPDVFTGGQQVFQSLAGQRLPNAPRNKIAINGNYTWHFEQGSLNASLSYIWRDAQYGTLFTRSYNKSPAWDQVDARMTWNSANGHYKIIAFGKNLFQKIGYDAGAYGTRVIGINDNHPLLGEATSVVNQGIASTYSVTPPRTYGVEVDYKF